MDWNTLTIQTLAVIVGLYVLNRAVGGIISEYAKRIWFGIIEPWLAAVFKRRSGHAINLPSNETNEENEIVKLQSEIAQLKKLVFTVCAQRDEASELLMKERIDKAKLIEQLYDQTNQTL
jgi:hypothetical protein